MENPIERCQSNKKVWVGQIITSKCSYIFLSVFLTISLALSASPSHAQKVGDCWDIRIEAYTECEDYDPSSGDSAGMGGGLPGLILFALGIHPVQIMRNAEEAERLRYENLNLAYDENRKCAEKAGDGSLESYRNALPYCQNAASICARNDGGENCNIYKENFHNVRAWIFYRQGDLDGVIREIKAQMPYCRTREACDDLNNSVRRINDSIRRIKAEKTSEGDLASASETLAALSGQGESSTPTGLEFVDPRKQAGPENGTDILLDALQAGHQDWGKSVAYLERKLAQNPGDIATRDALAYVKGLHEGHLMMSEMNDASYKRGVFYWMGGDYGGAATAFARAYQQNPDDIGSLQAFALVSGINDGTVGTRFFTCSLAGTCDREIDPPSLPYAVTSSIYSLVTPMQREQLERFRANVVRNPGDRRMRAALNFVDGMAAWDDYKGRRDEQARISLSGSIESLRRGDYQGAVGAYLRGRAGDIDNPALTYAYYHARGLDEGTRYDNGETSRPEPVWDERMSKVYTELLTEEAMALAFKGRLPWTAAERNVTRSEERAWARWLSDPLEKGAD